MTLSLLLLDLSQNRNLAHHRNKLIPNISWKSVPVYLVRIQTQLLRSLKSFLNKAWMNRQLIHWVWKGEWQPCAAALRMARKRITAWKASQNFTGVNQFEKSLKLVLFLIFCFIKKKTRQSTELGKRRCFQFHCLNIFFWKQITVSHCGHTKVVCFFFR